jgi:hypothetical protein
VDGAAAYRLVVADGEDFTEVVVDVTLEETAYTPPQPLETGDYYWRVNGVDENGLAGPWSAAWSFAVNAHECIVPPPPALASPAGGASVAATPVFVWDAAGAAEVYDIHIGDDLALANPLITAQSETTTYMPEIALPAGVYYWRVRGHAVGDCDTPGEWSETWSFSIEVIEQRQLFAPVVLR